MSVDWAAEECVKVIRQENPHLSPNIILIERELAARACLSDDGDGDGGERRRDDDEGVGWADGG